MSWVHKWLGSSRGGDDACRRHPNCHSYPCSSAARVHSRMVLRPHISEDASHCSTMYEYGYFQFCQHYMTQSRHEDRSGKCMQYSSRHLQDESEGVVFHGRCCNGSKAAATRRPSSDSRLYVVQAFHCAVAPESVGQ
jgi:hypothetical protein